MDYVILVVLVLGINEKNAGLKDQGPLMNHPFLTQLQLDNLPKKKGEASNLPNNLDYSSLFNKARQPYKIGTK